MQASLLVPDLHGPWHPLLKAQINPKDPYDSKGYTHTECVCKIYDSMRKCRTSQSEGQNREHQGAPSGLASALRPDPSFERTSSKAHVASMRADRSMVH